MEEQIIAAVYDPPDAGLPWLAVFIHDGNVSAFSFSTLADAQAAVDDGAEGLARLVAEQG